MVTRWGMSTKLGPMVYGKKEELVFLGREISEQRDYSDAVAQEIDSEVRRLIGEAYDRARSLLTEYRDKLDAIARRLMEVETIDSAEFERIFPTPNGANKHGSTPMPVPAVALANPPVA